jgi:CopG family nickel-responsive transcriptional regulator
MKDPLVRFGVAIERSLLRELDALVKERGCTRSELLRDLARAEVGKAKVQRGGDAVCALTLVYDHHVRDLSEKLTELQHRLGEGVRAAMHVHLSHALCLEVVVMRGKGDQLQGIAARILAMRGVKQGGVEIVGGLGGEAHPHEPAERHQHRRQHDEDHDGDHRHQHQHEGDHPHPHGAGYAGGASPGRPGSVARPSAGGTARSSASARGPGGRRAAPEKTGTTGSPATPTRRGRSRRGRDRAPS